jgi:hypothetical protein
MMVFVWVKLKVVSVTMGAVVVVEIAVVMVAVPR